MKGVGHLRIMNDVGIEIHKMKHLKLHVGDLGTNQPGKGCRVVRAKITGKAWIETIARVTKDSLCTDNRTGLLRAMASHNPHCQVSKSNPVAAGQQQGPEMLSHGGAHRSGSPSSSSCQPRQSRGSTASKPLNQHGNRAGGGG